MRKIIIILSFGLLFACSSENTIDSNLNEKSESIENLNSSDQQKTRPTTYDLIYENLEIFWKTEEFQNKSTLLYYCSEELGGYVSLPYLTQSYYLNAFYAPIGTQKRSDLHTIFTTRFKNANASGNHSRNISIEFEIYTGGVFLNATESNRVYNEFICQFEDLTDDINQPLQYNINFIVDYLACCTGSFCCYPIVSAQGTVYWN